MVKEVLLNMYKPRSYQYELEQGLLDKKRAIAIFHRRAGKDLCSWNILIRQAIERKGIYYYTFPTYKQARRSLWEAINNDGVRFLDYIPPDLLAKPPTNVEMKLDLVNGSIIRFLGSDNYDDIRGTNPIGVVLSEYAYQRQEIWTMILEPILRLNGGWALFNSTPYGKNHFYELYQYALQNPSKWYVKLLTIEDTKLVKPEELDELKAQGVSEEVLEQEYRCSFSRGVEGSYYARMINDVRLRGQIGPVLHDPYHRVYTSWDIGIGDSTAIFFFQVIRYGQEIRFIDYYEASGESLEHYAHLLDQYGMKKKYKYAEHFAPHDIKQRELGTGTTRLQLAESLGVEFTVVPLKSVETGIEICRKLLPRCWFDDVACKKGITALESYHKRYDIVRKCYSDHAEHDSSSHGADSFRYACSGIEDFVLNKSTDPLSFINKKKDDELPVFGKRW